MKLGNKKLVNPFVYQGYESPEYFCDREAETAILSILQGREPQFENMVQFFTENQFALLKAIAKEDLVQQPTAGKFIKEHNLSGASSAKAALKVLEEKELVYKTPKGYIIYDRFMDLWLKRL